MSPHLRMLVLAALTLTPACDDGGSDVGDGADDSFLGDGKADTYGISGTSYEAAAILDFASTATAGQLAAAGISAHARSSTLAASRPFANLVALDAVPYTGPLYFSKLLAYVTSHGLVGSCGDGIVQPLVESCDDASCAPCRARAVFDESHRIASIPIPTDAVIRGLSNDELVLAGASSSGTVTVGPRTLTGHGVWIARVTSDGSVPYLKWLVEGYPLAVATVNVVDTQVQVQVRTNTVHPDADRVYSVTPASGVSALLGNLTPTKKLLAWGSTDALVHFANPGGGETMEMLDEDSLERLWAAVCPRGGEVAFGHDQVWCSDSLQPSQQRLRRYQITDTTVTTLPPLELGPSGIYVGSIVATSTGFAVRTATLNGPLVTTFYSALDTVDGVVTIPNDSNVGITGTQDEQTLFEIQLSPTSELGITPPAPAMYFTLREYTSTNAITMGSWLTSDSVYGNSVPVAVTPHRVAIAATARFALEGSAPYALVLFRRP